jgi:hypothetical protein
VDLVKASVIHYLINPQMFTRQGFEINGFAEFVMYGVE